MRQCVPCVLTEDLVEKSTMFCVRLEGSQVPFVAQNFRFPWQEHILSSLPSHITAYLNTALQLHTRPGPFRPLVAYQVSPACMALDCKFQLKQQVLISQGGRRMLAQPSSDHLLTQRGSMFLKCACSSDVGAIPKLSGSKWKSGVSFKVAVCGETAGMPCAHFDLFSY